MKAIHMMLRILRKHLIIMTNKYQNWINEQIEAIRTVVKDDNVVLGLSGGVDSTVVAQLLKLAIGKQLTAIFVNHGLLRKGEVDQVLSTFQNDPDMNFVYVDASDRFLGRLAQVSDPEEKRKIIGHQFIEEFKEVALKVDNVKWLAQGTIKADIMESGKEGHKHVKSHHNVGGLPESLPFKLLEPLVSLYKYEVRELGLELGISHDLIFRPPFPGPGIAIRIIGDITPDKIKLVQESDYIFRDELKKANLHRTIWQYFTVLTDNKTVGVKEGARTYEYTIALRAVHSSDGLSAEFARIPYEVLENTSQRIVSEVEGINRVVYDITSKPPASIEWE